MILRYENTQFVGNVCYCHEDFIEVLDKINTIASNENLQIYITSSLRKRTDILNSTVVEPSTFSNHLVGHAIDFNLIDPQIGFINKDKITKIWMHMIDCPTYTFLQFLNESYWCRWESISNLKVILYTSTITYTTAIEKNGYLSIKN